MARWLMFFAAFFLLLPPLVYAEGQANDLEALAYYKKTVAASPGGASGGLYVVSTTVAPMLGNTSREAAGQPVVMKGPDGKKHKFEIYDRLWLTDDYDMRNQLVYGNLLYLEPDDVNWFKVAAPAMDSSCYIEKRFVTKLPAMELLDGEVYAVKKETAPVYLLPNAKSLVDMGDGLTLVRHEVINGVAKAIDADGQTWILTAFGSVTPYDVYGAFVSPGQGGRWGWIKADGLTSLADLSIDPGTISIDDLPAAQRLYQPPSYDHESLDALYKYVFDQPGEAPVELKISGWSASDWVQTTAPMKELLLKHGFLVDPAPVLFPLEVDDLRDAYATLNQQTPLFITADWAAHSYHLVLSSLIKNSETEFLSPALANFTASSLATLKTFGPSDDKLVNQALSRAEAFFTVTSLLLSGTEPSADAPSIVQTEYARVMAAAGMEISPVTGALVDYSIMKPRGHYNSKPELTTYFRAMSYMNTLVFFAAPPADDQKAADLMVTALLCLTASRPEPLAHYKSLSEPLGYLMGRPNKNSPDRFAPALDGLLGEAPLTALAQKEKLAALYDVFKNGQQGGLSVTGDPQTLEDKDAHKNDPVAVRLLGKYFVFDAYLYGRLTGLDMVDKEEVPRGLPSPLDLMNLFDAALARELTAGLFEEYSEYGPRLDKARLDFAEFAAGPEADNIYTKFLLVVKAMTAPSASTQFFAKSKAWGLKSLNTALFVYSELKHDTILYAEQSYAEGGEGDALTLPGLFAAPSPRGYVEPAPEAFAQLAALSAATKGLYERLPGGESYALTHTVEQLDVLSDFARRLETIARKEINGEMITLEDYAYIQNAPNILNCQSLLEAGGCAAVDLTPDKSLRQMALTADIATDAFTQEVLHVGTGTPRRIEVYVADQSGGRRLTTGYIGTYYEYVKGGLNRETDENWRLGVYNPDPAVQNELAKKQPAWLEGLPWLKP